MALGGIWKAGFGNPKADPETLARIKQLTRMVLELPEDATVSANEILCADPSCPGQETVVLVMVPGQRTRAYKVQAAMDEVTEDRLREAIKAASGLS